MKTPHPLPVQHHPVKSDDESITSTTSDRQLRPRVPISYNETVLNVLTWTASGQNIQQLVHTTSK